MNGFAMIHVRVLKRARDYHVTDKPKIIFQNHLCFLLYSTTTCNDLFLPNGPCRKAVFSPVTASTISYVVNHFKNK